MRTYTNNSPQAAARLVALALLADGHAGSEELDALENARVCQRLGLRAEEFHAVMQGLCEDLLSASHMNWGNLCRPDSDVLQHLAGELTDPLKRVEVLELCRIAAQADRYIAEGEFLLLNALANAWQLSSGWDVICHHCAAQRTQAADIRYPAHG
jgi:hypothetical protein